jgi:diguanylate cyclase (GGDEF)-like protein
MARALASLFAAGFGVGLAMLAVGDYSPGRRDGLFAILVVALLVSAAVTVAHRRLPRWSLQALLGLGTLLITAGIYVVDDQPVAAHLFYVWVALYAAYFFTYPQAIAQISLVGITYAWALSATGASDAAGAWVVTVGTLGVTAAMFRHLRVLLDRRLAEKERSERELEASLSLQRATLESTADGILVVDREGSIVGSNGRFQRMWRIPDEVLESGDDSQAIAFVLDQLADPDDFLRKISQLYDRPDAESYDMLDFKDGRVFERYSKPQRASGDRIYGRVWSFRDVTDRERIQARLRQLADHDPLTGLLNRRRFEEEVAARVAHAARYRSGGAVLILDLDNFKYINDSLGHRAGDAVIRTVAQLLRDRLRTTDVLARLGGDEYAVLLPTADERDASLLADGLLEAVRRHRAVFSGRRVRLTTSIGIAPVSGGRVQTAEELLVEADVAMYAAKEQGRDRARVYQAPDAPWEPSEASLSWTDRIGAALNEDRLTLYAQPIVELRSGVISQYELLVRMVDEDGKLLPPNAFLPSAERSGLIEEIDSWVTARAIDLIDREGRAGRELRLEINLSGRTLASSLLPRAIEAQLGETSIDPANLIFEVTETAAVVNMDEAKEFVSALAGLGCRFALDDFGAGFGSFYYLKYMPLDYLKIDGDFIADLGSNPTDQAVVKAIVELARQLDMATIAEFVGDERTIDLLREYGVDHVQGYHVGRPQPVDELWSGVERVEIVPVPGG